MEHNQTLNFVWTNTLAYFVVTKKRSGLTLKPVVKPELGWFVVVVVAAAVAVAAVVVEGNIVARRSRCCRW